MQDDGRKKQVDALYRRFGMKNEEGMDFDPYDPILGGLEKSLLLRALQKVARQARAINGTSRRIK